MREIRASDLMNSEVLTVPETMSVKDLAAFLVDNEISGAPVVDDEGKLVGVVSVVDVAAAATEQADIATDRGKPEFYLRDLEEAYSEEEIRDLHIEGEGLQVADIMTPAIYSVEEDAKVSEVAETMLKGHLHRLLVTRDDEIVGIISTSDLLGLLVDED